MSQRFYITTAIDYVNSRPHLGTAFEKIGADAIARYRRRRGFDVLFLMGNDEHSLNVHRAAKREGLDPLEYCDRMETVFRDAWSRLGISFDDFVRTTQPRHRLAVESLFRKIDAAGDLYPGHYEGHYCESCEAFKGEDDLEAGQCKVHQIPAAWIREENLFFRLSRFTEPLLRHFQQTPAFMEPERYRNEMLALLQQGLQDVAVSRKSVEWGIPVPGHPGQVVWVWFDALINYVSALGYGGADPSRYERFWPADVHVIGKDINRFHSVIWPAMLMSAGEPIPLKIWAHGWVHFGGQKMSKTRGTAVGLDEAIERHGPEALRFFLLREVPFDRDGDFTWERFDERYNTDLANTWGNLLSRVVTLASKDRTEGVPRLTAIEPDELDLRLQGLLRETVGAYCEAMDRNLIHQALEAVWRLLYEANYYVDRKEPWKLAADRQHRERLDTVLRSLLVVLRETSLMLSPVLPETCRRVWEQLGNPGDFDKDQVDPDAEWDRYYHPYHVAKGKSLFPKPAAPRAGRAAAAADGPRPAEATAGSAQPPAAVPAQETAAPAAAPEAPKPHAEPAHIEYDDFARVQLRVGHIRTAERVKKSDRLLRLSVDLGEAAPRQIVAGIASAYEPEQLAGRAVVVVANLKPRKIFGLESHGMLLVAQHEGQLELLSPGQAPPGSTVS
jgi:methionyl-tRNA synthetase